jgi:hypothetical protein
MKKIENPRKIIKIPKRIFYFSGLEHPDFNREGPRITPIAIGEWDHKKPSMKIGGFFN